MRESRTNARCASRGSRALRAAAVAVALLVPGLAAADEIDARMDRLHDRFQQCTRQHGYDPQSLGSTGPHEVAPGELQWRECAYDGVREIMVPASAVPDAYETLIALDRVMTREIEAGKRTRDQRRDRIQGMLDDIDHSPLPEMGPTQQILDVLNRARNNTSGRQQVDSFPR